MFKEKGKVKFAKERKEKKEQMMRKLELNNFTFTFLFL